MRAGGAVAPLRSRGFTLLELLVAMAIFAIIGALAMGGLNSVLSQQEVARAQLERLHRVQRAVRILTSDFSQLNPRHVLDPLGSSEAPILAPCGVDALVCFTHDGWRNPFAQFARGTLQRTQYRLEDDKLIRIYWSVLDRTLINEPREEVLLDGVDSFELTWLDRAGDGNWQTEWPPLQAGPGGAPALEAVRIALVLSDWGEIVRIAEVIP
jgi:general secretion pathway protein J